MTDTPKTAPIDPHGSLPFPAADELMRARVLPAEFSRLMGVSKQTVSRWIRDGKVTINPVDGRLDVQAATRQLLRTSDPGRLRARVLRQAVGDVQDLRAELAAAEDRAAALEGRLQTAEANLARCQEHLDLEAAISRVFMDLLTTSESALRATQSSEAWRLLLESLENDAQTQVEDLDGFLDEDLADWGLDDE